ncbi:MAG: hypothetical protein JWR69_3230 [Pedosphaera sp.]|nr:hypothetical protein [Pedosphaera sp.]
MNHPRPIFEELQSILSPLAFGDHDNKVFYPQVQAKIAELREWGIDEGLLRLIDDDNQIMLKMRPGDECTAAAHKKEKSVRP